tara:strand:- start:38 stop:619 length:582 start_codon:yes stop_codon:yes gene_type:complete
MELNDLVKVYDNVLDHDTCKSWIEYFESSDKKEKLYDNGYPNWHHVWVDYDYPQENMVEKLEEYKDIYFRDIAKHYDGYYPFCEGVYYYLEQWKIKRYNPGLDEKYDAHVDNIDFDTSERYLSFIFYLNDVEEGGETCFEHRKIQPKEGRLVVFPPMWMFPHSGNSPISNTKYIMSTYLRYDKVWMEDSDGEN